ncbi:23103_t:CDS:2, partial [Rhizophagus irregularis]
LSSDNFGGKEATVGRSRRLYGLGPDNFVFNHTPLVSKPTSVDIFPKDDIPSDISFPLLPTQTIVDNSFLVSFKKFHVTSASKTGYNKIYEFSEF